MKHVTKKTLGAAALGAAVAAAGAGVASAAGPTDVLGAVGTTATGAVSDLPVKDTAHDLPGAALDTVGKASESLAAGDGESVGKGGGMLGGIPLGSGLPLGG